MDKFVNTCNASGLIDAIKLSLKLRIETFLKINYRHNSYFERKSILLQKMVLPKNLFGLICTRVKQPQKITEINKNSRKKNSVTRVNHS